MGGEQADTWLHLPSSPSFRGHLPGSPQHWGFQATDLPGQPIPLATVSCGDYTRRFSVGGDMAAHTRPAFRLASPTPPEQPWPQR